MVKYTLVYFNGRGRAEVPRLMFAQAGVQYEDKRIQKEDWAALKPTTPSGQLPFLEIDGERLGQSMAISRYLAREFSRFDTPGPLIYLGADIHLDLGDVEYVMFKRNNQTVVIAMYGDNNLESSKMDMLLDSINEFVDHVVKARFSDESNKEKAMQTVKDKAPVFFKLLNDTLAKSGSGWLVGNKVSVVDFVAYHYVASFITREGFTDVFEEMKKYNNVLEHQNKVADLPKIKEWIANRPDTPF